MQLLALPLLLALSPQDEAPAPPPMEALGRLVDGVWRTGDSATSHHAYEWGAGRRSFRSRPRAEARS